MFSFTLLAHGAALYLKRGPCSSASPMGWNCLWSILTARRGFGCFSLILASLFAIVVFFFLFKSKALVVLLDESSLCLYNNFAMEQVSPV